MLTPMMPVVPELVEEIAAVRREEGISMEELLAGLRAERRRLVRERYGDEPDDEQS